MVKIIILREQSERLRVGFEVLQNRRFWDARTKRSGVNV